MHELAHKYVIPILRDGVRMSRKFISNAMSAEG